MDAIGVCVEHPKAVGETFLVSDGQDVSIFLALDSGKIETFPVPIRNLLGWKAPWTLEEGIRETVNGI